MTPTDVANLSGREIRQLCRHGQFDRPTAGAAMGLVQVNLVILPNNFARDFEAFCRANPKPCPLLEVTRAGEFEPRRMAPGADLRTDLPRYRVYRSGELVDQPSDILSYWPADSATSESSLVAFLIGCSFTFELALIRAGVPVRHIEENKNVSMFRTSIPCHSVGAFHGPLVVSMRPMSLEQSEIATRVTASMPHVHGSPVHVGDPRQVGIADIHQPDYGDAVTIRPGEVPVFWACGVTPMEAIIRAKPPLAITHEPGHMFVTDIKEDDLISGAFGHDA